MAVFLGAVPAVTLLGGEWRLGAMLGLLLGAGFFGGMVLVPCESFVQIRPPPRQRGSVIAAANFAIFLGIFFSGPLADLLNDNLPPTASFGVIGGMALLLSVGLLIGLRRIETAH